MRRADHHTKEKPTSYGDLVQGTLEMLVLKTLALEPCMDMESRYASSKLAEASFA
jgi:hypothetical protein